MTTKLLRQLAPMPEKRLSQLLTTPSDVAKALNWRDTSGSILSLDIMKDAIGLALSSHPSQDEEIVRDLNPIKIKYNTPCETTRYNRKLISNETLQTLQETVIVNNVCAFIINWPIDRIHDRLGAECGIVLHILDFIIESTTILDKRPFCLYSRAIRNSAEIEEECYEDKWGRATLWSRPCSNPEQRIYIASKEQYNFRGGNGISSYPSSSVIDNNVAIEVMEDFLHEQWPDFF